MRDLMAVLPAALLVAGAQAQVDTAYIGRVDTIGGTTYDWQYSWSVQRRLANAPEYGVHAAWVFAADSSPWPGRNARYNFYDYSTREWNWIDPDYMGSGVPVFTERAGFGNLDFVPGNGAAIVCGYVGDYPFLIRDMSAGSGIFEACQGPEGYTWPVMATDHGGVAQVLMSDTDVQNLWHSRVVRWCQWDSTRLMRNLDMPTGNIAACKAASHVCAAWVEGDLMNPAEIHYCWSTDQGTTWTRIAQLEPPNAFGGDTVESFGWNGCSPFYDDWGRLHFVVTVQPVVDSQCLVQPIEIWHWCQDSEPGWFEIHRAGCQPENMQGGVGYNVLYADRPSMGQGVSGEFYVAWEQFDSSNVDPETGLLRAGVWLAASRDYGATWEPGVKITHRNTVSHRYPCVVDRMVTGGPDPDTVAVLYLMDLVAGAAVMQQGPTTMNPVVCHFVPADMLTGVAEERGSRVVGSSRPCASIVRTTLRLPGDTRATLVDIDGRQVADLVSGDNDIGHLAPGVYFVRQEDSGIQRSKGSSVRVVILR